MGGINIIRLRDNVSKIEELNPIDAQGRYCFFQMNGIFEKNLGFHTRGCEQELKEMGFDIPIDSRRCGSSDLKYCDFWHYQLPAVFKGLRKNGSNTSIYVGTIKGIDFNKVKIEPNDWQKMMLEKWNELFGHLADKNGWIKIRVWW